MGQWVSLHLYTMRAVNDLHLPVIDLEPFQTVALDKASGVVQVGGGVRLGNLADGIYQQGQRALSHGTCMYNLLQKF